MLSICKSNERNEIAIVLAVARCDLLVRVPGVTCDIEWILATASASRLWDRPPEKSAALRSTNHHSFNPRLAIKDLSQEKQ